MKIQTNFFRNPCQHIYLEHLYHFVKLAIFICMEIYEAKPCLFYTNIYTHYIIMKIFMSPFQMFLGPHKIYH
jgi:hypothetical protein